MGGTHRDVQRMRAPARGGEPVYGLRMMGAWVSHWRTAETTDDRALGVLEDVAWPAFLVDEAFSAVASRTDAENPD